MKSLCARSLLKDGSSSITVHVFKRSMKFEGSERFPARAGCRGSRWRRGHCHTAAERTAQPQQIVIGSGASTSRRFSRTRCSCKASRRSSSCRGARGSWRGPQLVQPGNRSTSTARWRGESAEPPTATGSGSCSSTAGGCSLAFRPVNGDLDGEGLAWFEGEILTWATTIAAACCCRSGSLFLSLELPAQIWRNAARRKTRQSLSNRVGRILLACVLCPVLQRYVEVECVRALIKPDSNERMYSYQLQWREK
jgi:hypothetical protein